MIGVHQQKKKKRGDEFITTGRIQHSVITSEFTQKVKTMQRQKLAGGNVYSRVRSTYGYIILYGIYDLSEGPDYGVRSTLFVDDMKASAYAGSNDRTWVFSRV